MKLIYDHKFYVMGVKFCKVYVIKPFMI